MEDELESWERSKINRDWMLGMAKKLKKDVMDQSSASSVDIGGLRVSYPYQGVEQCSYDEYVPEDVWECYQAMSNLFSPEKLPANWVEYMKEKQPLREKAGCDYPLDLISGVYMVLQENRGEAESAGIPLIESLPGNEGMDVRDPERAKTAVDGVLGNPTLRRKLDASMEVQIPDVSAGWLEVPELVKIINKVVQPGGAFVDMGCGVGTRTEKISKDTHRLGLGVERQYHPIWYKPWLDSGSQARYFRADARRLPFKDGFADACLLDTVVPHVSVEALGEMLSEGARVLKTGGYLIVGPQQYDYRKGGEGDGHLRLYRKEENDRGEKIFRRVGIKKTIGT